MSFDVGFDFRATAGFVTDPVYATYEILAGGGGSYDYPTTRTVNGQSWTFGWENVGGSSTVQPRDRSNTVDPRLAGINFCANSSPNTFRVDLPIAGNWSIGLAMGDGAAGNAMDCIININDTNSLVLGLSTNTTTTTFLDAANNLWTAAQWPTSNVMVQKTFGTTILRAVIGPTGSGNTGFAHLRLIQVVSGLIPRLMTLGMG